MKVISQHAVIGLAIAAVLSIGATAGRGQDPATRLSPLADGPAVWAATTFEICADGVLNRGLDAYGALIAQLRQIR